MMGFGFNKGGSGNYPLCPTGLVRAVCIDIVNLGNVVTAYKPKGVPMVKLVWMVDPEQAKPPVPEDAEAKAWPYFRVARRYTNTLDSRSNLFADLSGWCGETLTKERIDRFATDTDILLGSNCQLLIVHKTTTEGKTFANIKSVLPSDKEWIKAHGKLVPPADYVREKDRPKDGAGAAGSTGGGDGGEHDPNDEDIPF